MKCCGGCSCAVFEGELTDSGLDQRHLWSDGAQLPHAQSDQQRGALRIACQVSADGNFDVRGHASNHPVDQLQNRRIEAVRKGSDSRVGPVRRERVLGQVVRPDAHEVEPSGERRDPQRRGRHLDHDPDLQPVGPRPERVELTQSPSDFLSRRDHREHHLHRRLLRNHRGSPAAGLAAVLVAAGTPGCRVRRGTDSPPRSCGRNGSGLSPPTSQVRIVIGFPPSAAAIARNTSTCSSTLGACRRSPNSTSVRTSPDPSAPRTSSASCTDPTFASTSIVRPSTVTAGRVASTRAASRSAVRARIAVRKACFVRLDDERSCPRVEPDQRSGRLLRRRRSL